MTATHSFAASLAWGEEASTEPFWEAVYRKAFPGLVTISRNAADNAAQRLGIDRWIHLGNGKTLTVDEKRRKRERPDVLLEYLSNDRSGAVGWIEKDLPIDFLAYGYVESGRCLLFPWPFLRRAWLHWAPEWKRKAKAREGGFQCVEACNATYSTHSIAVPTSLLLAAVKNASIIDVAGVLP